MCNCAVTAKDQTKEIVFDYLESKNISPSSRSCSQIGFGLFLIPAPDVGVFETRTLCVENITYIETVKRGANCMAFQWIPKGMPVKLKSGSELTVEAKSDIDILGSDCTESRCKPSGCPMGCFCYSNESGNCHH